jgi:hypothetical protein
MIRATCSASTDLSMFAVRHAPLKTQNGLEMREILVPGLGFLPTIIIPESLTRKMCRKKILKFMKIVLNVDETGMWVTGVRKLLHIANIEFLNWYGYHRKRGNQAIDDLQILPGLRGTLVRDFWVPYFLNPSHPALYNAHLLYELKEISENYHQTWSARIPGIKNEVDGLHEHSDFFLVIRRSNNLRSGILLSSKIGYGKIPFRIVLTGW